MTNSWMLLFAPLRLVILSMEDLPHRSFRLTTCVHYRACIGPSIADIPGINPKYRKIVTKSPKITRTDCWHPKNHLTRIFHHFFDCDNRSPSFLIFEMPPVILPSPEDKEVFDLAASAMNRTAGHLQRPARKVILDAFKKARGGSRRELGSEREDASMKGKIYDIYIYIYLQISAVQYGLV